MKRQWKQAFSLFVCLALVFVIAACTDERTRPTQPVQPTYIETKVLADRVVSNGDEITASFTLRDEITGGNLYLYSFLRPDNDMVTMDELTAEIDRYNALIDSVSVVIFARWVAGTLTEVDSLAMEALKSEYSDEIHQRSVTLDSLDTWLDDRFKLSIWLDDDTVSIYPMAVMLDQATVVEDGTPLAYLGDSTIVWGQGNFLAEPDTLGWHGRRTTLDLADFWIADRSWTHPEKPSREEFLIEPARYPDRYTRFELLPVRNWLERLTPSTTHTLHVRFGGAGTETEVSAILYVVYNTAQ